MHGPSDESLPRPRGILGTYIVLKHNLRVFQIKLIALVKLRRLAVRYTFFNLRQKPHGNQFVVLENYT